MMQNKLLEQLMAQLNDEEKSNIKMLEVLHDPDCPKLHGKPCTCNPEYKVKELK
jgi:hypothetical protein